MESRIKNFLDISSVGSLAQLIMNWLFINRWSSGPSKTCCPAFLNHVSVMPRASVWISPYIRADDIIFLMRTHTRTLEYKIVMMEVLLSI